MSDRTVYYTMEGKCYHYSKGCIRSGEVLSCNESQVGFLGLKKCSKCCKKSNTSRNISPNVSHKSVESSSTIPTTNKKPKNPYIALALCFLLGTVGAHRFYVGKKKTGTLYLFTIGLFWFGVLYDLLRILWYIFKTKPKGYKVVLSTIGCFFLLSMCGQAQTGKTPEPTVPETIAIETTIETTNETTIETTVETTVPETTVETTVKTTAPETTAYTEPKEAMVWIPASGSKYHSRSGCSGMNNPSQVPISKAQSWGYSPCKRCY